MNNKKRMTLEEAKAMFPDNTPVFYYPVANEEALKRPTWVRGDPWEVSDGQVIVRVKDATGGVAVEHLVLREHGEHPAPLEATVEQLEAPAQVDMGEVSDGYHTFNELYAHRVRLFSTLMHAYPKRSWWSAVHSDGTGWDDWIIAGIDTPEGPATYHLPASEIPYLPDGIELEKGKAWDGHTAADVLNRLLSLRSEQWAGYDRGTDDDGFALADKSAADEPCKNWVLFEEGETLSPPVIYQYAATINTSRGTVSFDGIVFRPGYIRSMDDYQSIRQEVARDANVDDANAVNIINLNIVGGQLYEALVEGGL